MADETIEQPNAIDDVPAKDEYEVIELEYSEEDIEYYIEDEDGVELGFALKDEQGNVEEYYYEGNPADYEEAPENTMTLPRSSKLNGDVNERSLTFMAGSAAVKIRSKAEKAPDKIGEVAKKVKPAVKKSELKAAASDLNEIYRTGKEVGGELKSVYDDLNSMLEFIPTKKNLKKLGKKKLLG